MWQAHGELQHWLSMEDLYSQRDHASAQRKRKVALKEAGSSAQASKKHRLMQKLSSEAAVCNKMHSREHPNALETAASCARCRWIVHHKSWQENYGCVAMPGHRRTIWLRERPARLSFMGGWGVGCDLCANLQARLTAEQLPAESKKGASRQRLDTKWGRYQIDSLKSMQASTIRPGFCQQRCSSLRRSVQDFHTCLSCCRRSHASSDVHRTAVWAFLHPGRPLTSAAPVARTERALTC